MRLTKNLSKVTLKMSQEDVTGKMGLSWLTHSMEHFGIRKMVVEEYGKQKKSNREIEAYRKMRVVKKIVSGPSKFFMNGTFV